ncbi:hypothetical protein CN217_20900 [Sinorhizobium meliloti]|uniref:hypothetical protein n=1 Tax=Rhizobium meliloti TaxID=382 RepID=UPI000FD5DAB9|nr:hypothetical protein [Sinorhizobium meliloti]RVH07867.1 hypothetical protein CN217_20900 [Sinorhizobium meliloti]
MPKFIEQAHAWGLAAVEIAIVAVTALLPDKVPLWLGVVLAAAAFACYLVALLFGWLGRSPKAGSGGRSFTALEAENAGDITIKSVTTIGYDTVDVVKAKNSSGIRIGAVTSHAGRQPLSSSVRGHPSLTGRKDKDS